MPQLLADLKLAEVEDLVPVVAPVLISIFGPLGLLRYPTKPISMAVHVATLSICTCLQGSPPMNYAYAARDLLSSEVPLAYTSYKTEQQSEENMMGVIRACTQKSSVLPREFGPVNWYNAPLDLDGAVCACMVSPGEDVYVWRHAPSAARHREFHTGPELRAEWEDECLNL